MRFGQFAPEAARPVGAEVPGVHTDVGVTLGPGLRRRVAPGGRVHDRNGLLIDAVERAPFGGLRGAAEHVRPQGRGDEAERQGGAALRHPLLLFPQALLEVLEARQKVDEVAPEGVHSPGFGEGRLFPGGGLVREQRVEPHDLVFEVKIEFARQEALQVFVDEIVEVFAGRPGVQAAQEAGAPVVVGLQYRPDEGLPVRPFAQAPFGVGVQVARAARAPFEVEQHREHAAFLRHGGLAAFVKGQDEAALLFGVVLRRARLPQREAHPQVFKRPVERLQNLGALDVVLVAVRPVQPDLFAVIRQGVHVLAEAGAR